MTLLSGIQAKSVGPRDDPVDVLPIDFVGPRRVAVDERQLTQGIVLAQDLSLISPPGLDPRILRDRSSEVGPMRSRSSSQ
jgi:hypothetical protein